MNKRTPTLLELPEIKKRFDYSEIKKRLDYEFWKDFSAIISYLLIAISALAIVINSKIFVIPMISICVISITFCTYKMIVHKKPQI